MKTFPRPQTGFTLIELLVVIAIIGILSAVVLASLNDARDAARQSAVIQQTESLAKLLELNAIQTPGTAYTSATNSQWVSNNGSGVTCDTVSLNGLTAANQTKFRELCNAIDSQSTYRGTYWLLFRWGTHATYGNHYSIVIRPTSNVIVCAGSSGGRYVGLANPGSGIYTGPGCYYNP